MKFIFGLIIGIVIGFIWAKDNTAVNTTINAEPEHGYVEPAGEAQRQPSPAPAPEPVDERVGTLTLQSSRMIMEGNYAEIVIKWDNDTTRTFSKGVTVKAEAKSADGKIINFNTRSFFAHEYGELRPGFSGTLKIPVETYGQSVDKVSVYVSNAR